MERFKLATLGMGHYLSNEKNIIAEAGAVGETSQDAQALKVTVDMEKAAAVTAVRELLRVRNMALLTLYT